MFRCEHVTSSAINQSYLKKNRCSEEEMKLGTSKEITKILQQIERDDKEQKTILTFQTNELKRHFRDAYDTVKIHWSGLKKVRFIKISEIDFELFKYVDLDETQTGDLIILDIKSDSSNKGKKNSKLSDVSENKCKKRKKENSQQQDLPKKVARCDSDHKQKKISFNN